MAPEQKLIGLNNTIKFVMFSWGESYKLRKLLLREIAFYSTKFAESVGARAAPECFA